MDHQRDTSGGRSRRFTYVPGFFEHDRQPTGPDKGFRANTLPGLGILDRHYDSEIGSSDNLQTGQTQWQRFMGYLQHLNQTAPSGTSYKLLYIIRHGEGEHNVKEHEVGRHEWEAKWAHLEGDGSRTWADAALTPKGEQQAKELNSFWRNSISELHVPAPQSIYSSPLRRCLQTTHLSFNHITNGPASPLRFTISESLHEISGKHTCDRRRSRSTIVSEWPDATILEPLTENDELWHPDRRETLEEAQARIEVFLDRLFENDPEATYLALAMHSGAIRALHAALGHPDVWVAAGALVPVLVKCEQM
ncbi:phosphoglycerate mutase-like protein [Polychaeton citri CBS 116435]|uniref:Phosphoglycerate mutase-like protein n=1 Tax=Polychaeton citri CBS 116435 TaxID=1314669 RepID=A0A9P4QDQ6_9PEZI|nr:phosphoglycerate mutase-like protein [Polychaeton citri CBS 116435]